MKPEVLAILAEKEQTTQMGELLDRVKDLVKLSRDEMANYYDKWDHYDRVYRGEVMPDAQDKKAEQRGEPTKMIIPLTFSQVQTFVAFCTTLYTSREYFYELGGSGIEDERPAALAQATIEHDLSYNKFKGSCLPQFITDIGRFGIGVIKHSWTRDTLPVRVQKPDPTFVQDPNLPQLTPRMITTIEEKTKFLGNKIVNLSPYRFFPDPRLPLSRFQEGEFCASEDEFSRGELEYQQQLGVVAGLEHVGPVKEELFERRRLLFMTKDSIAAEDKQRYMVITEVQIRLNPATTMIAEGVPLDKDINREIKYLIWYANDSRIIRLEEMGYMHDEFTYDVAQFFGDQKRFINLGLAELLGSMQDTLNWFINSRITSVRKVISNKLIVDPKGVEMKDLEEHNPVIRLKGIAMGSGVDRWIKQLDVNDVTTNHLNDANFLNDYAKQTTGITENLLGQFATGRRSAQEARNVSSNAAARLTLTASSIWETALLPLGKKLLSNLRQGLDEQQLISVVGLFNAQMDAQVIPQFLMVDKSMLVGNYDFLIMDATLPSQRGANAQALQELVIAMSQNPQLAIVLGYDPAPIVDEILKLRNVRNAARFKLTPERLSQIVGLSGLVGNQGTAGGPPNGG